MTPTEALITAARRYCKENHAYWASRYAKERSEKLLVFVKDLFYDR